MRARVLAIVVALSLCALPLRADEYLTRDAALDLAFAGCTRFEKQLVLPTPDQRATLEARLGASAVPRVFECWVGVKDDKVAAWAVIDDVLGKSEPITYMLVAGADGKVRSIEILAYREARGTSRPAKPRERRSSRSRHSDRTHTRRLASAVPGC